MAKILPAVRKQPKYDEAIADIVAALKPWRPHNKGDTLFDQAISKSGYPPILQGAEGTMVIWAITDIQDGLPEKERPWRKEEIQRVVSALVATLIDVVSTWYSRSAIRKDRQYVRNFRSTVTKLMRQVWQDRLVKERTEGVDWEVLWRELSRLNRVCEGMEQGTLSQKDKVKQNCAIHAHCLIELYSSKKPTNGSDKAPFPIIAGILHSIVTGNTERPNLRRACSDVLNQAARVAAKKPPEM